MKRQNNMATDREKIQEVISKTEDHFEEKLTYISAGTLGLTLTFIEKIVPLGDSVSVIFLVFGWFFLVVTLLLNLSSHMISKHYLIKTQLELDKNNDSKYLNSIYLKVIKRNKRIDCINWITVGLLILGISFIVTFASLNSFHKVSKNDKKNQLNKSTIYATDSISSNSKTINYFYYGN